MTQAEFIALAPRVGFGGGLAFWMPALKIEPEPDGGVSIHVERRVLNREAAARKLTDFPDTEALLPHMAGLEGVYFISKKDVERDTVEVAIRRLLFFVRDAMVHEVDESIRFDGELARDPHEGEGPAADTRMSGPADKTDAGA